MLIGYARVSTDDQNLDLQIDALVRRGVEREKIYIETGSASSIKRRRQLNFALKDVRDGDTLVVWRIDRLTRNMPDLYWLLDILRGKNVGLESLTEHIDTNTASGRLAMNMATSFAQYEREIIAERTKAGLAVIRQMRGKGWRWGPKVIMTPAKIERAGKLLNRRDRKGKRAMSGPEVAARLKVSTASIYGFWKYNKRTGMFVRKQPADRGKARAAKKK